MISNVEGELLKLLKFKCKEYEMSPIMSTIIEFDKKAAQKLKIHKFSILKGNLIIMKG